MIFSGRFIFTSKRDNTVFPFDFFNIEFAQLVYEQNSDTKTRAQFNLRIELSKETLKFINELT